MRTFQKFVFAQSAALFAISCASAGYCMEAVEPLAGLGLGGDVFAADRPGDGSGGQLQVINDPAESWDQFEIYAKTRCAKLKNPSECNRIERIVDGIQGDIVGAQRSFVRCDSMITGPLRKNLRTSPTENNLLLYQNSITNFSRSCAVTFSADAPANTFLPAQRQALAALGVVVREGVPQCSGLLTGAFFITAQHCQKALVGADIVQASTGIKIEISGKPERAGTGDPQWVANDYAIYRRQNADEVELPIVRPVAIADPVAAFVVAARPYFAVPAEGHLRDIVISQPNGFCHAMVNSEKLCLEMQCPTMPSYSGAPVFRLNSGGKNLEVIGLVYGGRGENSRCEPALENSTFVVPISRVLEPGKDDFGGVAGSRR